MLQSPTYWGAKKCVRLQNKTQLTRKVCFFFVYISRWSLVTFFTLQYVQGFCIPCDLQGKLKKEEEGTGEEEEKKFFLNI